MPAAPRDEPRREVPVAPRPARGDEEGAAGPLGAGRARALRLAGRRGAHPARVRDPGLSNRKSNTKLI